MGLEVKYLSGLAIFFFFVRNIRDVGWIYIIVRGENFRNFPFLFFF